MYVSLSPVPLPRGKQTASGPVAGGSADCCAEAVCVGVCVHLLRSGSPASAALTGISVGHARKGE